LGFEPNTFRLVAVTQLYATKFTFAPAVCGAVESAFEHSLFGSEVPVGILTRFGRRKEVENYAVQSQIDRCCAWGAGRKNNMRCLATVLLARRMFVAYCYLNASSLTTLLVFLARLRSV
jgi:hypothetical protein